MDPTVEGAEAGAAWRRLVGGYSRGEPGTVVIAVCGLHGNEPAGVRAAEHVLEELSRRRPSFRGEFVAIAGNLGALERGRRYLARDLNRQWTPRQVAALGAPDTREGDAEEHEQREFWDALRPALDRGAGPAVLLDLHTSSADGPPFATVGDTLRNRLFVSRLPIPVIMGLEEVIDGSLLEFVNNLGHVTVGVEAGRHDLPFSVAYHEAVLWLALAGAGCISEQDASGATALRERLARATEGIPRLIEVRHRHAIRPGDSFRMTPGYRNFDRVRRGDILGEDAKGRVRARESGVVLLPLYQGQGDDGFFLGREVSPLWLRASSVLRRAGLRSLPRLLPGVRPHPESEDTLIVQPRAARLYPLNLFHLAGYRKRRWQGGRLLLTRRRECPDPRS